MALYEYKVVPAPRKGVKIKGVKTNEARFSFALQELMNQHGAEGWEYQRAETLPCDERQGLTGSQTVYRDVLVFRRPRAQDQESLHQETLETRTAVTELPPEPTLEQPPEHTTASDPLYADHDHANDHTHDHGATYETADSHDAAEGATGHDSLNHDPTRTT